MTVLGSLSPAGLCYTAGLGCALCGPSVSAFYVIACYYRNLQRYMQTYVVANYAATVYRSYIAILL